MQTRQLTPPRPVTPHGILSQKLAELAKQASYSQHLGEDFKRELSHVAKLAEGLEPYIQQYSTPESEALSSLTRKTQAENWAACFNGGETVKELEQEMLSGHLEGQFLKALLHGMRAQNVLEIGLFTGYSALAMAEVLPENGRLVACELDAYAAKFARDCFATSPHGHKIEVKVGPAIETINALADAGAVFDFVFIDADKGGYLTYLDVLLERGLLAPHGLIGVDNTLMQGQPYLSGCSTANGEAIARFNQKVAEDERVHQVILPVRDGFTLIYRSGV